MENSVQLLQTSFTLGYFWCHCFCNSLYSGWVTAIELHVQWSATWVGPPYPYWSIHFTDIGLCPCQQHFTYGPHRFSVLCSASDICIWLPIKQLDCNPTHLFYNTDLAVITRQIPTADTEKPFEVGRGTSCPERLCNSHSWRFSRPNWIKALSNLVWP